MPITSSIVGAIIIIIITIDFTKLDYYGNLSRDVPLNEISRILATQRK